jgi:hypothetical protein
MTIPRRSRDEDEVENLTNEQKNKLIQKSKERFKEKEKLAKDKDDMLKTTGFFRWIIINDKELMDYICNEVMKRLKEEKDKEEVIYKE